MHRHWLASLALTSWMLASPTLAGEIDVLFDLSTSQLTAGGLSLPATTQGTTNLNVQADGPTTPLAGPAVLSDLSISMEIFAPILPGSLTLFGPLAVQQRTPANGNLSADLSRVEFGAGEIVFDIVGSIDCQGSFCSIVGPLPIVIDTTFVNGVPMAFNVANLDQASGAMLLGSATFVAPTAGTSTVGIMGIEAARAFDPGDTDGDGIPDDADRCVNSILDPTVVIDGCDSGVPNAVGADGCSISDQILECDQGGNHGSFVSCVAQLRKTLDLDSAQNGAIQSCAARSSR